MYTNQLEYENIFGPWTNNIAYKIFEDYAVLYLENYCYAFPNLEEWETLDEVIKTDITNAIYYQINYMSSYDEYFINGKKSNISSMTIGRYSVSGGAIDYNNLLPYSEMATRLMDGTGMCNNQICKSINKCVDGCIGH